MSREIGWGRDGTRVHLGPKTYISQGVQGRSSVFRFWTTFEGSLDVW